MAKVYKLKAIERKEGEKSNHVKKEGFIPAVIYGPGLDRGNIHLKISSVDTLLMLDKIEETTPIQLNIEKENGETYTITTFLKTVQRHKVSDKPIHADFYVPAEGHKMHLNIPIEFVGEAKGLSKGGMLDIHHHELPVEILPKDIVEKFVVDITDLDVDDHITVKDLNISEEIDVLLDPEEVIVAIPVAGRVSETVETSEEEIEEETGEEA
ncbi:large subunit ribosomal protein L25 [Marinitoga hydrogenitolerans DSM 16785]|uniref:Large ribosomal subunit protein bL25 n=1 Tax=Marinitoga hydrogenitolerans (strain DSM 16785 / JCM 12826 / AT1271) TaxID=1122195 RepID=A0A1M4TY39_MARH1|nr:50S ribosomal protein L25 [Marinitoga hydrogenitolerans]SHE49411.1 large subunit ribosomal protein L25 [Marinitoga hydrogenitolerans DSM 16785]